MELFTQGKKYLATFAFNKKQKILNTLTYDGDDMLESEELYKQVYDMILKEEQEGVRNRNANSMMNLIINLAKDLNGYVNYVFKSLALLIKCFEHIDIYDR
jgi:hypothetical protein